MGIFLIILIVVGIYLLCYYLGLKCPVCGKPGAMCEINKNEIGRKAKWLSIKHDKGTKNVPGYEITYEVTSRCKYCGYTKVFTRTETIEDRSFR